MIRDMKWHVYQKGTDAVLIWTDGRAIEFDTEEEIYPFLEDYFTKEELEKEEIYAKYDILYYDDGYISTKEINTND